MIKKQEQMPESMEDFGALLDEYMGKRPVQGQVVKGTVTALTKDEVIVDVGLKSEKGKNLDKILKKESSHLNTEDMDTEVLLQMTNTLTDDSDDKSKDEMLDIEENDTDDLGELNDYLDDYSGNEKDFDG